LLEGGKHPARGSFLFSQLFLACWVAMAPAAWCLLLPTSCLPAASEGGGGHLGEGLPSALPNLPSPGWHLLHLPAFVVLSWLWCQPKPQTHLPSKTSPDLPHGWFMWGWCGGAVASSQTSLLRNVVASFSDGALKFVQLLSTSLLST